MTICSYPGCNTLVIKGRCKPHAYVASQLNHGKERERSAERRSDPENRIHFYTTPAWRAASKHQLSIEPLCRDCMSRGRVTEAREVDHITAMAQGGEAFSNENLQSLCKPCHTHKTNTERAR